MLEIEAATYPVSLRASPEIKLLRHQQDRRAEATKPSLPQGLEKRRPSRYGASTDASFSLVDNPKGIADHRQDRRRYPRMVTTVMSTPRVLNEAEPSSPTPVDSLGQQTKEKVNTFENYRYGIMRAAFTAELTALTYAHLQDNLDNAVKSSTAVVKCMGGHFATCISSLMHCVDHDRGGPPAQGYHNANVHVFGRGV